MWGHAGTNKEEVSELHLTCKKQKETLRGTAPHPAPHPPGGCELGKVCAMVWVCGGCELGKVCAMVWVCGGCDLPARRNTLWSPG